MPIYEYKCKNCGEKFEVFVFSSSDTSIICGKCGSENVDRLMSGFASTAAGTTASSCGNSGRFS